MVASEGLSDFGGDGFVERGAWGVQREIRR